MPPTPPNVSRTFLPSPIGAPAIYLNSGGKIGSLTGASFVTPVSFLVSVFFLVVVCFLVSGFFSDLAFFTIVFTVSVSFF